MPGLPHHPSAGDARLSRPIFVGPNVKYLSVSKDSIGFTLEESDALIVGIELGRLTMESTAPKALPFKPVGENAYLAELFFGDAREIVLVMARRQGKLHWHSERSEKVTAADALPCDGTESGPRVCWHERDEQAAVVDTSKNAFTVGWFDLRWIAAMLKPR